ncbi:hypothetical protein [Desulfobacter postgatei]|uniref:hypothetical protein n=1 Tax=Desulfobacter postgatei TaxID=2293 RepID=UPI00259B7443|nr:hypothetical protein [uncultured Desulfobacter sp.]
MHKKHWSLWTKKYQRILFVFMWSIIWGQLCIPSESKAASSAETEILIYMNSLGNMPNYCKCRLAEIKFEKSLRSVKNPNITNWPKNFWAMRSYWVKRLHSETWRYLHHYCRGIQKFNDFKIMPYEKQKTMAGQGKLKNALEEFRFMQVANVHPSFPFWYPLYMNMSQIYTYLGEHTNAQQAMKEALRHKRKSKTKK